jgi:hypothetical protein
VKWTRSYLLGFAQAAYDIARGELREWLLVGVAVEPFRMGYRAGHAAASGR